MLYPPVENSDKKNSRWPPRMNLLARHPSQTTSGRLWTPCTWRSGRNPPPPMPWKGNCTRPCYFGSIRGCCRVSGQWSATFGVYHEPWAASLGPESGGGAEAPSDPPPLKRQQRRWKTPRRLPGSRRLSQRGHRTGGLPAPGGDAHVRYLTDGAGAQPGAPGPDV